MKNYIPATFLLTLIVVGVLMGLYFLPSMSVGGKPLRKVDLLADIRPDVEEEVCDSDTIVLPPPVKPIFVDTCKTGITCIEDYSDSTMRGMKHFYEALSKVKTMKRPVRIAYFGDSFIEADIFTADLREMLQQEFGGCGVGYVPVTSSISGYRPTVRHTFGGWSSHSSNDSVGFDKMQQIPYSHQNKHFPITFYQLHEYLGMESCTYLLQHNNRSFKSRITEKYPAETNKIESNKNCKKFTNALTASRLRLMQQVTPEFLCSQCYSMKSPPYHKIPRCTMPQTT
jgi:hypothetical protein